MLKIAFSAAVLALGVAAEDKVTVTVYEGPKECEDDQIVKKGQHLQMHYTGTIDESSETGEKGKQFDSSRTRGATFDFEIGAGAVIKGWDEGLIGLCKGAKATLVIPPSLGYGARGAGGDIPGGATLNFDVEVVDFSDDAPPSPPEPNMFVELDVDKSNTLSEEEILAYFQQQGQETLPEGLMESEDKDKDGVLSWEEFSGPKGDAEPVHEEL